MRSNTSITGFNFFSFFFFTSERNNIKYLCPAMKIETILQLGFILPSPPHHLFISVIMLEGSSQFYIMYCYYHMRYFTVLVFITFKEL